MDGYVYSVLLGILTGFLFSYMFNIHSKRTADSYTHSILNMNSTTFIKMLILFMTFFLMMVIGNLSLLIRDIAYPMEHPIMFSVETVLMGIIPASTLFILYYLRGSPITKNIIYAFGILSFKFMMAHVLLQASGIYASIFKDAAF